MINKKTCLSLLVVFTVAILSALQQKYKFGFAYNQQTAQNSVLKSSATRAAQDFNGSTNLANQPTLPIAKFGQDFNRSAVLTTGTRAGSRGRAAFWYQSEICQQWTKAEDDNKNITLIRVTPNKAFCRPTSIGNKLLMAFSVLSLAYNRNIPFQMDPPCAKSSGSVFAWMPLDILTDASNQRIKSTKESEIQDIHSRLCHLPFPQKRDDDSWIQFIPLWRQQLQAALTSWAIDTKKEPIARNTAAIHIRCGDIFKHKTHYGFNTLNFYKKHLLGRNISHIDILTASLKGCNSTGRVATRIQDCREAEKCSKIIFPFARRLAQELNFDEGQITIRDDESVLWSMHHLAFSHLTLCGFSSFCLVSALASNNSIHSIIPTHNSSYLHNLAESTKFIPKYLDGFQVEADIKYLSIGTVMTNHWAEDNILEYMLKN